HRTRRELHERPKTPGYTRRVRIAIGGDQAGYPLKQHLIGVLKEDGHDANVLSIGARIVAAELADERTRVFLSTSFDRGAPTRRLEEITDIENEEAGR